MSLRNLKPVWVCLHLGRGLQVIVRPPHSHAPQHKLALQSSWVPISLLLDFSHFSLLFPCIACYPGIITLAHLELPDVARLLCRGHALPPVLHRFFHEGKGWAVPRSMGTTVLCRVYLELAPGRQCKLRARGDIHWLQYVLGLRIADIGAVSPKGVSWRATQCL